MLAQLQQFLSKPEEQRDTQSIGSPRLIVKPDGNFFRPKFPYRFRLCNKSEYQQKKKRGQT